MSRYTCVVVVTKTYTLHVDVDGDSDSAADTVVKYIERVGEPMLCDERDIHVSCVIGDMPEHYGINAYNVTEDLLHDVAKDVRGDIK